VVGIPQTRWKNFEDLGISNWRIRRKRLPQQAFG
jgi:hypothetical protein